MAQKNDLTKKYTIKIDITKNNSRGKKEAKIDS